MVKDPLGLLSESYRWVKRDNLIVFHREIVTCSLQMRDLRRNGLRICCLLYLRKDLRA